MSFVETLDNLPLRKSELVQHFEQLIASKSDPELEAMAQASRSLTLQNFGRTMRLFAPLYLSNECINNCRYCGFSRDNPILRVTLEVDEVVAEAQHLARQVRLAFGRAAARHRPRLHGQLQQLRQPRRAAVHTR